MSLMIILELIDTANQFTEIPGNPTVILLRKRLMIKKNLHVVVLSEKQVLFESRFHGY